MPAPRVVSDDAAKAMLELYQQGATQKQIAAEFGVSTGCVSEWICRQGGSRSKNKGVTCIDTARSGHEIAKLYRRGLSVSQIAKRVGRTAATVHSRLVRMGVERRRVGIARTFPAFEVLVLLLKGLKAGEAAERLGVQKHSVFRCLYYRGFTYRELENYRPILAMDEAVIEVFRAALMDDGLSFPDAYEIAQEYAPQRRAA